MSKAIVLVLMGSVVCGLMAVHNGAGLPHWVPPLTLSTVGQQAGAKWAKDTGDYHRACAAKLRNHDFKNPAALHEWLVDMGKTAHADLASVTSPITAVMVGTDGKPKQTLDDEAAAKAC